MSSIAIITARGGSKRIPKKNIKDFCGKPIIAYSIEAALNAGIFDEVMVSTDSEEIKEIAEKYGAVVPFMRSEETSNDYATTNDVLNEVIQKYALKNISFDTFCCLYPTAPFITTERLIEAYDLIEKKCADAVIPVVKFNYPPQRAYVTTEEGKIEFQYPKYSLARSQDLRPIYHDTGQFYFYRTSAFMQKKGILCDNTVPIVLSDLEVQDIDYIEDWEIAEIKYKMSRHSI